MNLIGRKFENSRLGMEIFVYEIEGKEWFMATDVCRILEHTNVSRAVDLHVKWKKDKITKHIDFVGISEGVTECYILKKINSDRIFISKDGVLQLISASEKLSQQQKQEWYNMFGITEVLKSRKEIEFGCMLEEALYELEIKTIPQYNVDNKYRIDFYIPQLNIAV